MPRMLMLAAHHTQNSSMGVPCRSDSGMGSIPWVSMLQTRSLSGCPPAVCSTSTPMAPPRWAIVAACGSRRQRGSPWDTTRRGGDVKSGTSRIEEVQERFARSGFHRWIGMRLERVEIGEVDVALDVEPHHLNLVGLLHGGLIAPPADPPTGLAYRTVLEPGTRHVTTHLSVTFLSPGRAGLVTARGKVVKSGRRFGYAEADAVGPEDELLARATATFTVSPERADQ